MFNAMSMLGQAKALVDPAKTLKQERLSRGDFESKIDELSGREGDKYNFSEMRKDPKTHAILKGLLGALAGGGVGYLGGGGGIGSTLAGAGIGGLGGAGIGAMGAENENRKLHSTAKVLKQYGLLQPEYLRQALPLLKQSAQDNGADRLSASGEDSGVTFKHDDQGHLTGADAFKTLDGYMKKAGMNSFQRQFFGRLIQQGMDEAMIRASVKTAVDRFGEKVAADLEDGLDRMEKSAFVKPFLQGVAHIGGKLLPQGLKSFGRGLAKNPKGVADMTLRMSPKAFQLGQGLRSATQAAPRVMAGAAKAAVLPGREGAKRALGQMGTGAATGAFNPYTGASSDHVMTADGFRGDRLLQSIAGGALLGRVPGAQRMMQRGMAGSSAGWMGGYGANALGHLTGYEPLKNVDPATLAQGGFGLAAASGIPGLSRGLSRVPGVRNIPGLRQLSGKKLTNQMMQYDPYNMLQRGLAHVGKSAWKNPGKALQTAATPAAVLYGMGNMQHGLQNQMATAQVGLENKLEEGTGQALDHMSNIVQYYDPQIQQALSSANQASDRVNNLLGGQGGGLLSSLFGEGGQGGMMGGVSDYVQKNPWLIPLLLGGLGAGGGYAMGGGGGAALGGFAAPLLYMLATGQLGNTGGGQNDQDNTADDAEVQRRADENAKVTQGIENPVADVQQQHQNEIQRQQQQQRGQYGEGSANMQIPGKVQQYASPDELAMLQNPNLTPEQRQDMIQQITMRGPADQPGDEQRAISRLYTED